MLITDYPVPRSLGTGLATLRLRASQDERIGLRMATHLY